MVDGVADQVDQRIGQALDHGLVEFGVFAGGDELDVLVEIAAEIVHQAAEAAEQGADRHHADAHGGVAQARGQAFEFFGDGLEIAVAAGGGDLGQAGLGNDQFADPVHQFVEPFGIDAHRGGCRRARRWRRAPWRPCRPALAAGASAAGLGAALTGARARRPALRTGGRRGGCGDDRRRARRRPAARSTVPCRRAGTGRHRRWLRADRRRSGRPASRYRALPDRCCRAWARCRSAP